MRNLQQQRVQRQARAVDPGGRNISLWPGISSPRKSVPEVTCASQRLEMVFAPAIQPRRFPSDRETRAVCIGVEELVGLLEWRLRKRARALRNLRREYSRLCLSLYSRLQRAGS
jgi:hypothetical protein